MKKVLSKLFGEKEEKAVEPVAAAPKPAAKPPPSAKKIDFSGKRQVYAVAVTFPEYKELGPLLSVEGHNGFIRDFKRSIDNAFHAYAHAVEISDTAVATIAVDASAQQPPNVLLGGVGELYNEIRLWVGTFGRTGLPPMKYGIGVTKGEATITPPPPPPQGQPPPAVPGPTKIEGRVFTEAAEIAERVCSRFDVRLGVVGEIIRASTESVQWFDVDDVIVKSATDPKPVRLYSRIIERVDPADIQMFRAARKAYANQQWDEAAAKFDRLTVVPHFKHLATLYAKRVDTLRVRPKDPNWDGVYRK